MSDKDIFRRGRRCFSELAENYSVLMRLVSQQLVLRYRRTMLGYLWTLINPLLMMSIMSVVFSTLFKADLKEFTIFLFAGMIPWNFLNAFVSQSTTSFIGNESLIKKIYLPKAIFPLSISIALLVDSLLSFVALFIILIILGSSISWALLFIPVAYLLLFFFAAGIGLIVSVATVFIRDLQYLISIVMQALFFLTPIFYRSESLAGKVKWLIELNPIVPFIDLFRWPLTQASLPDGSTMIKATAFSLASFLIGLLVFLWQEKRLVFRL